MAVILGLAVAVAYGTADFLGGVAAKHTPLATVVVGSQAIGLPALLLIAPLLDGSLTGDVVLSAIAAGVASAFAITALYAGLSRGRMSVVAPITAVGAAALPVLWGIASGERPSGAAMAGVGIALVAVVLVSRQEEEGVVAATGGGHARVPALALAVGAGIGFGVVFVVLGETSDDGGLWPLAVARATSVTLLTIGALVLRERLLPEGGLSAPATRTIAATGVLDLTANALFVFATQRGLLSLVAVIASLYPAATVVLARVVLAERFGRVQAIGLGLAGTGVLLIAVG
ncbi:MAG TPA: DMT family transporter [Acidimicrobiales bacterium]